MKKITTTFMLLAILFAGIDSLAQENNCKLKIGTNLGGICDWMTEMPFVDMMHNARTWCTSNRSWIEGGVNEWNTNLIDSIERDENGYPLEVPFWIDGVALEDSQMVFCVWAWTEAWEAGTYVCLYDGEGEIAFNDNAVVISNQPGRMEVNINPAPDAYFLDLRILRSKKENHIRNIRLIMPGHEATYATQPFNPLYLEKLQPFAALRFMDWGATNNWGHDYFWTCDDGPEDTILTRWDERSKVSNYTWATNKGVPYEIMCDLCNTLNKDMWVCVPHCASNEYIREMARLIKGRLNPGLKVYAEYSNETWNWMFGQTQWLYTFYCTGRDTIWPEGIVDRVQNNLDIWTSEFTDSPSRLIRTVGVQTAWQDVSNRIMLNLKEGSYDAIAITGYFGLGEQSDSILDILGSSATVADVARLVRGTRITNEATWIQSQYDYLASVVHVPVIYYEAGQHITPTPFGEMPTYANALLAIQRDTAMYNLYTEWYSIIEDIVPDDQQTLYMNFSFIGTLDAQYGSWGILETLDQDTSVIPAPKYSATLAQIRKCESSGVPVNFPINNLKLKSGIVACYNAWDTITVAGSDSVILQSGSSATFIAGRSISILPGFDAQSGCSLDAHITTDSTFCDGKASSTLVNQSIEKSKEAKYIPDISYNSSVDKSLKVYPNPNNGQFTLEMKNMDRDTKVWIYNSAGRKIYHSELNNPEIQKINLLGIERGVYLLRVVDSKGQLTKKIIVD
jgi:hypothetical protein